MVNIQFYILGSNDIEQVWIYYGKVDDILKIYFILNRYYYLLVIVYVYEFMRFVLQVSKDGVMRSGVCEKQVGNDRNEVIVRGWFRVSGEVVWFQE